MERLQYLVDLSKLPRHIGLVYVAIDEENITSDTNRSNVQRFVNAFDGNRSSCVLAIVMTPPRSVNVNTSTHRYVQRRNVVQLE
jgi:hypothetical protein